MNEWEWQLLEERIEPISVAVEGVELKKGDLVRLLPRAGGDIFDVALVGKIAIIESIEQDYEGKIHLAVVVEDDPGRDLGALRQPGHRFFFTPDEVRPVSPFSKILVAGIGNVFLADDGFGVEVVGRLSGLPPGVTAKDFGIRSYDLAYALLDDYDVTILVDAVARGGVPGTLYVIEPEISEAELSHSTPDAHSMDPVSVLRLAKSMGPVSSRILVVGCEPENLGGDEGEMGLSAPVAGAIEEAVRLVEKLIARLQERGKAANVV